MPNGDQWMTQMLARIDPDDWWAFVVCADKRSTTPHPEYVVGVIFRHVEFREYDPVTESLRGQLQWAPRMLYLNDAGTEVLPIFYGELLPDEQTELARRQAAEPAAHHGMTGRGSYNIDCPGGCHYRVARDTWNEAVVAADRARIDRLDLSVFL